MFDRVTKAYLWIMLCMAFSVGTVSVEAQRRDHAIDGAVQGALVKGLESGCNELTNPVRRQTMGIIAEMETLEGMRKGGMEYGDPYWDKLRLYAKPVNCHAYARNRSGYYSNEEAYP